MKDVTEGSIAGHLISLAMPTAIGMLLQTLCYFVDLYFVAGLGDAAVAGVSAAGNVVFIIAALTQALGVGTAALISHAVGRKDQQDANLSFNQSLMIAALCGVFALIAGYALAVPYLRSVAADEATAMQGRDYLYWLLPGMAPGFAMAAMSSALLGTGIVKPAMLAQVATLLLNTVLTPVLIAGWGTGYAMGVAGAGLASTIAKVGGLALLWVYFIRLEKYVSFDPDRWQPRFAVWKRILTIGLPAGSEPLLLFAYNTITLWALSTFGPAAQAGFAIGLRIQYGIFLPAMAIAVAVAPIAGQNFGARQMGRVRETFRVAAMLSMGTMLVATLLCQWEPEAIVQFFSPEPDVLRVGVSFLRVISWNLVLAAVTIVCSGVFRALGNTIPSLLSSGTRLTVYALLTIWLTSQSGYKLEHVWYVSIAATALQAAISLALLRKQIRLQLGSPVAS